jgi:hypothetical protein
MFCIGRSGMASAAYIRFRPPSSLCTTGLQAHILTGVFLQLVRNHFSIAENIEEPRLRNCLWVPLVNDPLLPDPERSRILIEPVYRWDPSLLQSRPAIIVRRGALTQNRVGIAMNEQMSLGGLDQASLPLAGREYYLPFQGSHVLFCIAGDGGVAELLSTEIARELYQFARPITEEFGFEIFELGEIGEVQRLEEHNEQFVVPVAFTYRFYDQWVVSQQEPRFSGVKLDTQTKE